MVGPVAAFAVMVGAGAEGATAEQPTRASAAASRTAAPVEAREMTPRYQSAVDGRATPGKPGARAPILRSAAEHVRGPWEGGGMIAILGAPSNLGLRPPEPGAVPGAGKAPEALREAGLHERLIAAGARDAGVVLPGRYVDDDDRRPPGRVRNQDAMIDHARRLAARVRDVIAGGDAPLVLGGDCSILLGAGVALGPGAALVHVDGHTDFRHPGNSDAWGSVAGEDLAAAIGLHIPELSDIDGRGPYYAPGRTAHLGCRDDDAFLAEAIDRLALVVPASTVVGSGAAAAASASAAVGYGYWLQVDVDVLDPVWMPAVDSPDAGGLSPDDLVALLAALAPGAVGASVTVFDPDLDPGGRHAALLADIVVAGLGALGAAAAGRR
jgi:arginase